jgi:hypothetical protein
MASGRAHARSPTALFRAEGQDKVQEGAEHHGQVQHRVGQGAQETLPPDRAGQQAPGSTQCCGQKLQERRSLEGRLHRQTPTSYTGTRAPSTCPISLTVRAIVLLAYKCLTSMEEKLVFDTYRSTQKVRASRRHLGIFKPGHPLYRKGLQRRAQAAWGPPVDVEADMLLRQCLHRELLGADGEADEIHSAPLGKRGHGKGRQLCQLPQQSHGTGTPGLADPFRVCRQTCRLPVRSSGSTSLIHNSHWSDGRHMDMTPLQEA